MTFTNDNPHVFADATTVLDASMTGAQAIVASDQDFSVRLQDLQISNPEWRGDDAQITHKALQSDDGTVFTVVGSKYRPLQRRELFAAADTIRENGARFDSVISWRDRRDCMIQMILPTSDDQGGETVGRDYLKPRITMLSRFDGKSSERVFLGVNRPSCQNQFNGMFSNAGAAMFRVRHTASVGERVAKAAHAISAIAKDWDGFKARAVALQVRKMTYADQKKFVLAHVGGDAESTDGRLRNRYEAALAALLIERGLAEAIDTVDTAWTAFNAVTNACNHADAVARSAAGTTARGDALIRGRLAETQQAALVALTG